MKVLVRRDRLGCSIARKTLQASKTSQCIKNIYITRINTLKREEDALKQALKMYQHGLHALQIEELTIKYQMGKMRTFDTDSQTSVVPDIGDNHTFSSVDLGHLNAGGPDIDTQHINLRPLNLEATPLIQRMLYDSVAYEEEEEKEEEPEESDT